MVTLAESNTRKRCAPCVNGVPFILAGSGCRVLDSAKGAYQLRELGESANFQGAVSGKLKRSFAPPCPRYVKESGEERRQSLRSAATLRVSLTSLPRCGRFGAGICCVHPTTQLVFNDGALDRKSFTGPGNELVLAASPVFQRREHSGAERLSVGSILQQLHDRLVTVKVGNGARREGVAELLFHYFRIGVSDAEGNERSHVAEDGLTNRE